MVNAFTVDVEEYFHPEELRASPLTGDWDALPSRIEPQLETLLGALAEFRMHGTFFVLGWIAHRRPDLVRRIAAAGHEIACHSYAHRLITTLSPAQFRQDTLDATRAIEDACGARPRAYRAPSYSVTRQTLWALEILVECGYTHDSSIYPVAHDRYGIPGFGRFGQTLQTASGPILEAPPATVELPGGTVVPAAGGGYLRLLPYRYTAAALRRINTLDRRPACVYLHPWEVDPGQPRLATGWASRLRTYHGLNGMRGKLRRLLGEFRFAPFGEVYPAEESQVPAAAAVCAP